MHWKRHDETCAMLGFLRREGNVPAMGSCNFTNDGQPEPGTRSTRRPQAPASIERLEDAFSFARRNPDALIGHFDFEAALFFRRRYVGFAALGRVPNRVLQEITHHSLEIGRTPADRDGGCLHDEPNLFVVSEVAA